MKTVLVLDDHPVMLEYVCNAVKMGFPESRVIKAKSIEQAEIFIEEGAIQAAICDLQIKSGKSMVIPALCCDNNIPFMVYSSHVNFSLIEELAQLNVKCYVSKASDIENLNQGIINLLLNQHKYLCPVVLQESQNVGLGNFSKPKLSKSEWRVIKAYASGLNTQQVAEALFLQAVTIRNHRARAIDRNQCTFSELLLRFRYWED